jgi:hypothetical protein
VTAPEDRPPGRRTFHRALIDPAAAFASPEAVVRDPELSLRNKIEILCRWAYDAAELAVAEEEGMDGGEAPDMSAVLKALDQVTHVDVQHSAPTKHAAFCVAPPEGCARPAADGPA